VKKFVLFFCNSILKICLEKSGNLLSLGNINSEQLVTVEIECGSRNAQLFNMIRHLTMWHCILGRVLILIKALLSVILLFYIHRLTVT